MERLWSGPTGKWQREKSHHIFPFLYDAVHKELNCGQGIAEATAREVVGFFRHWNVFCHEPNQFVHLNSWELSHIEEQVGLFFRRLEVDLMEAWDDVSEAVISSLSWKKPPIPQQQGNMQCAYYMTCFSTSRCDEKAWMQFLMVASGSLQRMQRNCGVRFTT